jgi:hypothetical protein
MATPTLTSITPSSSKPGGKQVVQIVGTNYDVPTIPATGYVGGDPDETVQVLIDGRLATQVKVWASTLLTCIVPSYRGDPDSLTADPGLDVDVVIRNVGPPVESATFTDAFTYKRTDHTRTVDGPMKHILRTLRGEVRRQILNNVVFATSVDFDGDTSDTLDIVELAQIPGIALFGPSISEDKFRRNSERPATSDTGTLEYTKTRIPRVNILTFEATLVARDMGELMSLSQDVLDFFNVNTELVVDKDPEDADEGTVEYDMFLTDGPSRSGSSNTSDVYSATFTFTIHGVTIDGDEGVQIEWGKMVEDTDDFLTLEKEAF